MTEQPDSPAETASKAIFGAGIAAVAVGRITTIVRNRRRRNRPALKTNRGPHRKGDLETTGEGDSDS